MKTQGIIGRRIVAVEQSRANVMGGPNTVTVDALVLDNGVRLVTTAYLTDDAPVGDLLVVKPLTRKRARHVGRVIQDDEYSSNAGYGGWGMDE